MTLIRGIQVELNNMGGMVRALPHLARPCDRIAKEVLAFVCIMLFNANEEIQVGVSSTLVFGVSSGEELSTIR